MSPEKDLAGGCAGEPRRDRARRQPADAATVLVNQSGPGPLLPGLQWHSEAPVRPTVPYTQPTPAMASPFPDCLHTMPLAPISGARTLPHNEGGQMDAGMDRVTGFRYLQKAALQAATPAPPNQRLRRAEALAGRPADCKMPKDMPWAGHSTGARGQAGQTRSSTARGQVYSHLPHTEPSYPKQNRKEQKQRVSESPEQAGAGPRPRGKPGGQAEGCAQPILWQKS